MITRANDRYKKQAEKHVHEGLCRKRLVMAFIRKGRFLVQTYDKFQAKKRGPFRVVKKIIDNALCP